jgi:hypothetical protein
MSEVHPMEFHCFLSGIEDDASQDGFQAPPIIGSPMTAATWYFEKLREETTLDIARITVLWCLAGEEKMDRTVYVVKHIGNGSVAEEVPSEQVSVQD